MTPQEIGRGLDALMAAYPNMKRLEDETIAAYSSELQDFKIEDFREAYKQIVRTSKFFPTISEILDQIDQACRKRLAAQDHEEREERLALQAAEAKIMDPKSEVHRVIQGPNHQRFLDMLSGKIQLPEPEWMKRSKAKPGGEAA